jgi:hypothetical protein
MAWCFLDEVRLCYIIIVIYLPRVGEKERERELHLLYLTQFCLFIRLPVLRYIIQATCKNQRISLLSIYFIVGIKKSIVSRSRNDQKGSRAKERGRKKSIAFRNDSIIESREAVHGRQNSSIALSLKTDTKEAVKEVTEQKGLPPTLDSLFHILYFSRTYHFFSCTKEKKKKTATIYLRFARERKEKLI